MRPIAFLILVTACTASSPAVNDMSVPGDGSVPDHCTIGGTTVHTGATNPAQPCQSCQPALSSTTWSNSTNGMACGASSICSDGSCESTSGCTIGGMTAGTGMPNPADPCQVCRPSVSTSDWSERPDGIACGSGRVCVSHACVSGCFVDGIAYLAGAANPTNSCRGCQPLTSSSAFSNLADGASCNGNMLCVVGACMPVGCVINGAHLQPDDANPQNPCQSCQPTRSVTQWSNVSDGTACNAGMVCLGGSCVTTPTSCTISGQTVAAGTIDRGNLCLSCQPSVAPTQFTALPDGTPCNTTDLCIAGTCTNGCLIGGIYYAQGYRNPANPCQACDRITKTNDWTTLANGDACGSAGQCNSAVCYDHCNISGSSQPVGAVDPGNPCLGCQPGISLTAFSPLPSGISCGTGAICSGGGTCLDGCTIGGTHFALGTVNPQNPCEECQPILSVVNWSDRAFGTSCGINHICVSGFCRGGCSIGGQAFLDGDTVGNCGVCNAAFSSTTPSPAPDGTSCFIPDAPDLGSVFGICHAQICENGCFIDGAIRAAGALNPDNSCLECRPSFVNFGWSGRNGASCGTNTFCDQSGFCRFGCSIAGQFYGSGETVDSCTVCDPVVSTSTAQPAPEGTSCFGSTFGVCHNQTCQSGCFLQLALDMLNNSFVPQGAVNPGNPCQVCDASNPSFWTTVPNGTTCGSGKFCFFGTCGGVDMH